MHLPHPAALDTPVTPALSPVRLCTLLPVRMLSMELPSGILLKPVTLDSTALFLQLGSQIE